MIAKANERDSVLGRYIGRPFDIVVGLAGFGLTLLTLPRYLLSESGSSAESIETDENGFFPRDDPEYLGQGDIERYLDQRFGRSSRRRLEEDLAPLAALVLGRDVEYNTCYDN